jgi:hypothetical protein
MNTTSKWTAKIIFVLLVLCFDRTLDRVLHSPLVHGHSLRRVGNLAQAVELAVVGRGAATATSTARQAAYWRLRASAILRLRAALLANWVGGVPASTGSAGSLDRVGTRAKPVVRDCRAPSGGDEADGLRPAVYRRSPRW